jgi:hypothetical protein
VAAVTSTIASSPQLVGAAALYDKGDFRNASQILWEERERASDPNQQQWADFMLAKSYFHLGLPDLALSVFQSIAASGKAHQYHTASLPWLATLLWDLPRDAESLQVLDHYSHQSPNGPVNDRVQYLFAARAYYHGDLDLAQRWLGGISRQSPIYAMAQYLRGVTAVRQRQAQRASAAFRQVARAGSARPVQENGAVLAAKARLQLARVSYSTGDISAALAGYSALPLHSTEWRASLPESAWAYLRGPKDVARALGQIYSLRTEYADEENHPDGRVLEAYIFYQSCQYDEARAAARRARDFIGPMRKELQTLLLVESNDDFLDRAQALLASRPLNSLSNKAYVAFGKTPDRDRFAGVLHDAAGSKNIQRALASLDEIDFEVARTQKLFAHSDTSSNESQEHALEALQTLTLQQSFMKSQAGRILRTRVATLERSLQNLVNDARKIEIEALGAKADLALMDNSTPTKPRARATFVDDEHYFWPLSDTLWRDEVGSVHAPIENRCR